MLLLFTISLCVIIKKKSESRYLKVDGQKILTTSNVKDASKFIFDVINQSKVEYVLEYDKKAVDNYGQNGTGPVMMFARHGRNNQRWTLQSTSNGYKILQGKFKIVHNKVNNDFKTVLQDSKEGDDLFVFLQNDGKNHYQLKAEEIVEEINTESEEEHPVKRIEQTPNKIDEEPKKVEETPKKVEETPKKVDEEPKENNGKTINLFLIQRSESGPGFLNPFPILPNHTAFSGRGFVYNGCMLNPSYYTPRYNLCNIDDGLHGHTKENLDYLN
ncbi:hypothetical protein TUBRATIS_25630 [Tubulinosema ratisbonensis]|uniref:Ricin B lectin domain-containing protein n=1 Tax=Tubulinosema ratisbonensis TaxID=291195 RepID=A0A437AIU0_9MICR|nr:hypothetical protein TUBRATIS_25630 [Tubulinosema ratisbonensis]